MSGLASHSRGVTTGVLRRTVSNPVNIPAGLINEVKHRADAVDSCRSIWGRTDCEGAQTKSSRISNDIMSEFSCLERAVNEMEDEYSSSQRCFDKIETLIENVPSLSPRASTMHCPQETMPDNLPIDPSNGAVSLSISSPIFSARGCYNPAPDGPVYGAFQRELGLLRSEFAGDDRRAADGSPPRSSTPSCTSQLPSAQLLQTQLDEARASNRMAQRAITTLQVSPSSPDGVAHLEHPHTLFAINLSSVLCASQVLHPRVCLTAHHSAAPLEGRRAGARPAARGARSLP
jgi:hypothetical protein